MGPKPTKPTTATPPTQPAAMPANAARRPAWRGAGTPGAGAPTPSAAATSPALAAASPAASTDSTQATQSKATFSPAKLPALVATKVEVSLRSGQRYLGQLAPVDAAGAVVSLKLARDLDAPHQAVVREIAFPLSEILNIAPAGSDEALKASSSHAFRTDTDISRSTPLGHERELQPWQGPSLTSAPASRGDAETFGSSGPANGRAWDQFAENEKRFGTRSDFDEELYTTKLDRSGKDYRERERKAEQLAKEIMGTASSNPHMQEERGQAVNDLGLGEEDRFSGVIRGTNAYVPPGARRSGPSPVPPPPTSTIVSGQPTANGALGVAPSSSSASARAASSTVSDDSSVKHDLAVPKVTIGEESAPQKDAISAFNDFIKTDRQRLELKKRQIKVKAKSEKDKRLKEFQKFSESFKLPTTMPDDLVSILTKDADKQKAIVEKAKQDAILAKTRTSPLPKPAPPPAPAPISFANRGQLKVGFGLPPSSSSSSAAAAKARAGVAGAGPAIQEIPPFKGKTPSPLVPNSQVAQGPPSPAFSQASQASGLNKLNVNAASFVFKPNPNASAFKPGPTVLKSPIREIPPHKSSLAAAAAAVTTQPLAPSHLANAQASSSSQLPSQPSLPPQLNSQLPPNPFFGTKPFKKSGMSSVNVRDDFNPHKVAKLSEANQYPAMWSYSSRPFRSQFAMIMHEGFQAPELAYAGGPEGGLPTGLALQSGMPAYGSPRVMHSQIQGIHPGMPQPQHAGQPHAGQQQAGYGYPYARYQQYPGQMPPQQPIPPNGAAGAGGAGPANPNGGGPAFNPAAAGNGMHGGGAYMPMFQGGGPPPGQPGFYGPNPGAYSMGQPPAQGFPNGGGRPSMGYYVPQMPQHMGHYPQQGVHPGHHQQGGAPPGHGPSGGAAGGVAVGSGAEGAH